MNEYKVIFIGQITVLAAPVAPIYYYVWLIYAYTSILDFFGNIIVGKDTYITSGTEI